MRSVLLALLVLSVLGAAAPAAAIDVFVRSPRDGQVLFGPVEVEVEVLSAEEVSAVEIRLDGEVVGELKAPPYRLTVDVGDANRARTFEVIARDVKGDTARRQVISAPLELQEEVDLELQQLYVTVTQDGRRVLDLGREDFEVRDNAVEQRLVTFEGGDVPFTAVLLVDTSVSMRGSQLATAVAGARGFVARMRELDQAQVVLFADRVVARTPFTDDPAVIDRALAGASAAGGTAVNDHLYYALKALESRQGRRVVVLLSDGRDIESVLEMDDVTWKAGRVQALVYWIRPRLPSDAGLRFASAWRDVEGHQRELQALERLVTRSGGRVVDIAAIEEAGAALGEILDELREQYVLGYYPSTNRNDGSWHRVRVRVQGSGLKVRARGGYFDAPP